MCREKMKKNPRGSLANLLALAEENWLTSRE
jgi:hypothetical protein